MKRPAVLVVTRRTIRKNKYIDYVGEFHLALLVRLKTLPVMVPVVEGARACLPEYMADMRGLLLVEGEDIEPKHFKATRENYTHLEKTHPLKDEIEIELIRHALRQKLPILGICRGSQLLNVVCGGTLYGDVQKEKKSRLKHIDFAHYDTYRHPISIVAGSPLQKWYGRKDAAREQLPSPGNSRPGAALPADGICGGRIDRGLSTIRKKISWSGSNFTPSACWKSPPETGASGRRSAPLSIAYGEQRLQL